MRVGIDVSPLVQTRAGTARYIKGLLRELRRHDDLELDALSFGGAARAWNVPRDALWYPLGLRRAARALDVLHCPTYRGPVMDGAPLVVTVHDLAVFRHPEAFNRWSRWYGPRVVPRVLRRARLVIAVSEFTRRELVDLLGLADEKIRVIPNAVEDLFTDRGRAAEGEYVLTVGTLEPRKNLVRTADAARRAGVELRVVGARGWGRVDVGGNGVRWLGEVADERLAELYRGARCVAYPSRFEGFGIPVIEAMACGVPCVVSSHPSLDEAAGGAAVRVDPEDPEAITAAVRDALARSDELRERGLAHARRFTWLETGRIHLQGYADAL